MPRNEIYNIKVLGKAFSILALFKEKGECLTVQEISELLKFNKSSTYRIVQNLEQAAYLVRMPGTQKYKLGFGIYALGSLAESYGTIRGNAYPFLVKLNNECDETCHLAVFSHGQALYVEKIESRKRVLRIVSSVGSTLPSHCSGVGKMLLSALADKELDEVIEEWGLPKLTENTIVDPNKLKKELTKIKQEQYSVDNEEIEYGLKCIAAPIRDINGNVVAGVSISVPKERFDHEYERYKNLIIKTAQAISDKMASSDEHIRVSP